MLDPKSDDFRQFAICIALIYEEMQNPQRNLDLINSWLNSAFNIWNEATQNNESN